MHTKTEYCYSGTESAVYGRSNLPICRAGKCEADLSLNRQDKLSRIKIRFLEGSNENVEWDAFVTR